MLNALKERAISAARDAIERRLGGYRQPVHRDDPARPERPEGSPPTVAVIGGGIAGITAAATLAERGFAVTLFERNRYLGGKCGAWEVEVDGETQRVDHGFHAFFHNYHNLRALLDRIGCARHFAPIDDYMIVRRDRSRISFRGADTAPVFNLLSLAKVGLYSTRDLVLNPAMRKLDPFLRYDEARTFADWDHVSYEDFAREAGLPADLRLVFNTFARAFFSEGDRLSVAALIRAFHFYYLSNDGGLLYDYFVDDYETAFAAPSRAWLERHGARIECDASIESLARVGDGRLVVSGRPFDQVVLACDVVGAARIVASSPSIAEERPEFVAQMSRQRRSQRYAILRVWLDREVSSGMPVFVITDKLRALDAVAFTHRVVPEARAWAEKRGGGVYELHSYALPDDLADDAIAATLREEFEHFFPEVKGAKVFGEHLHVRDDFAAFHVGAHADRATVETGVKGLRLAGDWVRIPYPATLMEAACTSGLLAANGVLGDHGLREAPVYSVPMKGLLAR